MKYIFFDIDGTLYEHGYDISDKTVEALHLLRENGHKIFLSTGRNKVSLQSFNRYGFDGFIASAGGYVEVDDHVLLDVSFNDEDVKVIRDVLDECHAIYNLEVTDHTYIMEELLRSFARNNHSYNSNSEFERVLEMVKEDLKSEDISEYKGEPVHKICFILEDTSKLSSIEALKEKYRVIFFTDKSGTINGEINMYDVNKGIGVKLIIDYFQGNMKDTIGFGDSMNDLEMIKTVEYGVVMGNGSEELKQYADKVCEPVLEEGLYKELKRLELI